ncbi:carbohydrate ABC transporter permease [Paenibacillus sp. S150]|uniref:carbohydrate ABC transporter permease n=1 Tax=Paenibacillus sp. S150 TaxID=2749826 RepID=UPI001C5844DE|nr:carbohydrate ABC transporter permease [Paenibacillus sp. S150]MBW4079876.1 carbohydrate ABC transporter permease [Paenibacillus sp. S150]
MTRSERITGNFVLLGTLIFAAIFFFPVYIVLINSVKSSYIEIFDAPLALPVHFSIQNYIDTWKTVSYSSHFVNSLIVVVITVGIVLLTASMAAYKMARTKTRLSGGILLLFISSMLIPSQVIIIPLAQAAKDLHLVNSLIGLSLVQAALSLSMAIFLYHGFVKGIPMALDESARIDGAGEFRIYSSIILPLLQPVTLTVAILNVIGTWNAFLLPMILLGDKKLWTLPILAYSFISENSTQWEKQLPAVVLVASPIVIFYLLMQKYIIRGIADGAVKG